MNIYKFNVAVQIRISITAEAPSRIAVNSLKHGYVTICQLTIFFLEINFLQVTFLILTKIFVQFDVFIFKRKDLFRDQLLAIDFLCG